MQQIPWPDPYSSVLAHLAGCPTFLRQLHAHVFRILRCPEDVKDVLQETWHRVVRKPPPLAYGQEHTEETVRGRIMAVACNVAKERCRHNCREAKRRETPVAELPDRREEQAARREGALRCLGRLRELLEALHDSDSCNGRLLHGKHIEQRSIAELAAEEGLSKNAVRCRIYETMEKLRAKMREGPDG